MSSDAKVPSDADIYKDFRVIKNAVEAGYFKDSYGAALQERVLLLLGLKKMPGHIMVRTRIIQINFSRASYALLNTHGS